MWSQRRKPKAAPGNYPLLLSSLTPSTALSSLLTYSIPGSLTRISLPWVSLTRFSLTPCTALSSLLTYSNPVSLTPTHSKSNPVPDFPRPWIPPGSFFGTCFDCKFTCNGLPLDIDKRDIFVWVGENRSEKLSYNHVAMIWEYCTRWRVFVFSNWKESLVWKILSLFWCFFSIFI